MTVSLHIRRKPLYYAYTILSPTLVLCILNLFSFLLPCDNGDKVGIGLTVFLSLYVLQLAVAENIPESNSLPLIGEWINWLMSFSRKKTGLCLNGPVVERHLHVAGAI